MQFLLNKKDITKEEAIELLLQQRDYIAVDIETVDTVNLLPLGIAVAISEDYGFYFFDTKDPLLYKVINQTPTVIFHNAKFDLPILRKMGYKITNYEDTQILAYSAGILENSLHALSGSILGKKCPSVTSQWKKKNQGNIGIDHVKMGGMSIIHACNTLALWEKLPKIPLYYELDKPCIELTMELEQQGVCIDQQRLTEIEQECVTASFALEEFLKKELGDINFSSNPQMVKALQERGIFGTRKTKAGKVSISEDSLKTLHHPITEAFLAWKKEQKTLSTYVPAFRAVDNKGKIYSKYNYTTTGRWKSGDIEDYA